MSKSKNVLEYNDWVRQNPLRPVAIPTGANRLAEFHRKLTHLAKERLIGIMVDAERIMDNGGQVLTGHHIGELLQAHADYNKTLDLVKDHEISTLFLARLAELEDRKALKLAKESAGLKVSD